MKFHFFFFFFFDCPRTTPGVHDNRAGVSLRFEITRSCTITFYMGTAHLRLMSQNSMVNERPLLNNGGSSRALILTEQAQAVQIRTYRLDIAHRDYNCSQNLYLDTFYEYIVFTK